ncbi:DEAD/DEAH box helicase [Capnocytophaga bilenii]
MKFRTIFTDTERRLVDAILSLWATGDSVFQHYIEELLEKEKIMSSPVFQNTFPWITSQNTFEGLTDIFSKNFINSMDKVKGEYKFPKDRNPYIHQERSWELLLKQRKSIAVTTGTGSGKTECFMLPVLHDLYENCRDEEGVRAIFLYPLNALIDSQKKRITAWVKELKGLNFAIYNGNTPDSIPKKDTQKFLPELISRGQIREMPPQILFTNPSMLEYILVRDKDVPILEKSKGKLRWILLDEAHTLVGSNATEMALLIRRIIDAFQVDTQNLRFAITSATVGNGIEAQKQLKDFMSSLCGIDISQIEIISSKRKWEELPNNDLNIQKLLNSLNIKDKKLAALRKYLYEKDFAKLEDLTQFLPNSQTIEEKLEAIDTISDITTFSGSNILPLRGHFFARSIGGVYVCSNPNCEKHKDFQHHSPLGTMTTFAEKKCQYCGYPMYELVACRSCGNELFMAERSKNKGGSIHYKLPASITKDNFLIEDMDDVDEKADILSSEKVFFTRKRKDKQYVQNTYSFSIDKEGKELLGEDIFIMAEDDHNNVCTCPYCNNQDMNNPLHFRISSSFMNRVLSDIFLENTPEMDKNEMTTKTLWGGHKYISFTDSRQGTAKISALINNDNEANWLRAQVFHRLWEVQNKEIPIKKVELIEIEEEIKKIEEEIQNTKSPYLINRKKEELSILKKDKSKYTNKESIKARLTWKELQESIRTKNKETISALISNNYPLGVAHENIEYYIKALFFDSFARRVPRERSLENLGMISLVYPNLDSVFLPVKLSLIKKYNINIEEWKSLLKIALDYIIRSDHHYELDSKIYPYSTSFLRSTPIYPSSSGIINAKEWIKFDKKSIRPGKLSLLICAGLNIAKEEVNNELEDEINEMLEEIWKTLIKQEILTLTGDNKSYKIDIEKKSQFQVTDKVWLCPVKKRLIDVHFRGVSPWINGKWEEANIQHFKIKNEKGYQFPHFPYPFNFSRDNQLDVATTKQWIVENSKEWRKEGLWNNIIERIILNRDLYLSGEHSAQQNRETLNRLEKKFEEGQINILNCSTTMEMGVDIGGVSTVIMNNVPPAPANYLQRAGRAGRRGEKQSLSYTICPPNPVGINVLNNPDWALKHKIAPPSISFNSPQIIERHINAFFLGKFVQQKEIRGLKVMEVIEVFFFSEDSIAEKFINWLSKDLINYKEPLQKIIKETIYNKEAFSKFKNDTYNKFIRVCDDVKKKRDDFEEQLENLKKEFGEDTPAYKAVQYQKGIFLKKNAISYLVEEGFLSSAGLPTGIVEFNTYSKKNSSKDYPSYEIVRALMEFAPGNNIVINGLNYHSSGILLDNRGNDTSKEVLQFCNNCGYQRIVEVNGDIRRCPNCGKEELRGIQFKDASLKGGYTEFYKPVGFAVDYYSTPNRKISETSNIQYTDPVLINVEKWEEDDSSIFQIRNSEKNGEILYYNVGRGNGFYLCTHCGRTTFSEEELKNHKRLRGGKNDNEVSKERCLGNEKEYAIRKNVVLGGSIKTDFCEIRIKAENGKYSTDKILLYTLGAILVRELSAYLGIEKDELGFGVKRYEDFHSIFIFDTARGGAGYSIQLISHIEDVLKQAMKKLECTCDTACTRCLIDRDTQWHIDYLDRKLALEWIKKTLEYIIIPDVIKSKYPQAKRSLFGIKNIFTKLLLFNNRKVEEVFLFVNDNIKEWDIEQLSFIDQLKKKGIKLNFVFNNQPNLSNKENLLTIIQVSAWAQIYVNSNSNNSNFITILKSKDSLQEYFSDSLINLTFSSEWGKTKGSLYSNILTSKNYDFSLLTLDFNKEKIKEVRIEGDLEVKSSELAKIIIEKVANLHLNEILSHKKVDIVYSDRYLKSPFACILMLQFINKLKEIFKIEINSFTFKGQVFQSIQNQNRREISLINDFLDLKRNEILKKKIESYLKVKTSLVESTTIPHFRYLELNLGNKKVIIRPDGGIQYGWWLNGKIEFFRNNDFDVSRPLPIIKKSTEQAILYTISLEDSVVS